MNFMGFPISNLFLYFILYSFLGWVMETCYCSIAERRLVARGFSSARGNPQATGHRWFLHLSSGPTHCCR